MKWNKLGKLSAFARAESHLVQKTSHGAIVTICGTLLAVILFGAEIKEHFSITLHQEMIVDTSRDHDIRMSFDVVFPSLPCQVLSMDLIDAAGGVQTDADVDAEHVRAGVVHKYRLDHNGRQIGLHEYHTPKSDGGFFFTRRREDVQAMDKGVAAHEGCHIYGFMDVKRIAAHLHISVHMQDFMMLSETQKQLQKQIQEQMFSASNSMGIIEFPSAPGVVNMSHIIRSMNFGPSIPGQINPLDGLHRTLEHEAGTFKYFLKIVPTAYKPLAGRIVHSNQYSVTEYFSKGAEKDMTLPSIWFSYDLSPIGVVVNATQRSILHLLVRFCAVCGGVFAVTGLMDQLVHKIVRTLVPQQKLG